VWYVVIFRIALRATKNTIAKFDGPMTCGYGIDAIDAKDQSASAVNVGTNALRGKTSGH